MNIMNVLRTGMNMSITRIYVWLCNTNLLPYKEIVFWLRVSFLFILRPPLHFGVVATKSALLLWTCFCRKFVKTEKILIFCRFKPDKNLKKRSNLFKIYRLQIPICQSVL